MTQEQLRMQMLAGIITESQYKAKLNEDLNGYLEKKIQQWVDMDAGGYGPDDDDEPSYTNFKKEMNNLLNDTLEDFNLGNYGDSTTMSPNDILEDFINNSIDIISKYTMSYYGDSTSFSPNDIKNEFYEFVK